MSKSGISLMPTLNELYPERKVKLYYSFEIDRALRSYMILEYKKFKKIRNDKRKKVRSSLRSFIVLKTDHRWYGRVVKSCNIPNYSGLVRITLDKKADYIHTKFLK